MWSYSLSVDDGSLAFGLNNTFFDNFTRPLANGSFPVFSDRVPLNSRNLPANTTLLSYDQYTCSSNFTNSTLSNSTVNTNSSTLLEVFVYGSSENNSSLVRSPTDVFLIQEVLSEGVASVILDESNVTFYLGNETVSLDTGVYFLFGYLASLNSTNSTLGTSGLRKLLNEPSTVSDKQPLGGNWAAKCGASSGSMCSNSAGFSSCVLANCLQDSEATKNKLEALRNELNYAKFLYDSLDRGIDSQDQRILILKMELLRLSSSNSQGQFTKQIFYLGDELLRLDAARRENLKNRDIVRETYNGVLEDLNALSSYLASLSTTDCQNLAAAVTKQHKTDG